MTLLDPKWTPERLASLRRVIEAARAFVRCADEFVPDDGQHFYPGALGEYADALDRALSADGRAWDEGPDGPPLVIARETLTPVDAFAAPASNPGARGLSLGWPSGDIVKIGADGAVPFRVTRTG